MTWCRQARNHYPSQRWPRYLSPYGITRSQWVKNWSSMVKETLKNLESLLLSIIPVDGMEPLGAKTSMFGSRIIARPIREWLQRESLIQWTSYLCHAQSFLFLTHWGRVTHICVSELTIIISDNGLPPGRRQAIIWNNAGLLLIEPLGTNFSEISIGIQTFSFKKIHLNMSSAKWRPFCLGLNVLSMWIFSFDKFPFILGFESQL